MARIGQRLALLLVLVAFGTAAFVYLRWVYREQRFNQLIEEIAARQGADKFLIKAVMRQESGFDPFAYSKRDAIGLMQVTEAAGWDWAAATRRKDFSRDLLWDPRANIEAGTWYLQRALRRWNDRPFEERIPFALAEYNAGYGNVQRWLPQGKATASTNFLGAITFPGVRHYIGKVTGYYQDYRHRGAL
jgi:soluble lytic murein transglycosylase